MKKYWFLLLFSLFFVSPMLVGCGGQTSQESAREQVEREDAEAAAAGIDEDEEDDSDDDEE